jgi:hypothetical protein
VGSREPLCGYAAIVRGGVLVLVLVAVLTIGARTSSASVYRGVITNGAGAVRSGEQGALWQSRFVEHKHGRVEYSACVIFLDARAVVLCKPGHTNSHGVDRVSFSEFVNMHPGHWVVRFFKLGHTLASWRFTVRSEGA